MDLLFIGDSLIEYYDWQGRFPGHKAVNLGLAGESVQGLLSRLAGIKVACPNAGMIFIMTGINNVAMDDLEFFGFYTIIIERLLSLYPRAKIYIHSLLPSLVDFITDESILLVNNHLKKLAADTGVEYLDMHGKFTDTRGRAIKEYLLDDGVHVSGAGYTVWAKAIEEIIDQRETA